MLILLSPAKTLDYISPVTINTYTLPTLITHSQQLIAICRDFSSAQIASLMKVSDKSINNLEGIKAFCGAGYMFSNQESTDSTLIFNRGE